MENTEPRRDDPLRDWLEVEGDLDDFLFYGCVGHESEK